MSKYIIELWDPKTRQWEALPTPARDLAIATRAMAIGQENGQRARIRRADKMGASAGQEKTG